MKHLTVGSLLNRGVTARSLARQSGIANREHEAALVAFRALAEKIRPRST